MKKACVGMLSVALCAALLLLTGCGENSTTSRESTAAEASTTAINIYIGTPETLSTGDSTALPLPGEPTIPDTASPPTVPAVTDDAWKTIEISMPDANGSMTVDTDPENKFTKIISEQRGIDSALLVAVFSLPDTGQNYVVEFDGTKKTDGSFLRSADTFRRLFLIDETGAIDSVASVNADETENVSSVENWFCVNVFIKGLMLPKIESVL